MDSFWWLIRGGAIGLAVAIPVGPIALLCMRRTLEGGSPVGLATGVGAALADVMYAALAAFGIAAVEAVLLDYRGMLSFVGGVFLVALAGRTACRQTTVLREVNPDAAGFLGALVSGFVLTATNPLTVLGFVAIFAGFGVGKGLNDSASRAIWLVLGVFAGSVLWWVVLTGVVARARHLFSPEALHRVNLIAALLIAGFGFYELIAALMIAAPWLF